MGFVPKRQGKAKQPILTANPPTPKIPFYLGSPNLEARHIAWRLSKADVDGPFSCGDFVHDDFKKLWDRLRAFEKMSIAEFKQAGSFHKVPTLNLSKLAKSRLQGIGLDDVDVLYSFRITGACRLWCMKHENLLSVLWWDEKHEVYPSHKKNT